MTLPLIISPQESKKAADALQGIAECVSWDEANRRPDDVIGILIFGHALVDGEVMDRYPNLKIISNCGVGVDHINIPDAKERNIKVGNTPGVLSGATADMGFALLLAAARRLVESDAYSRAPENDHFDDEGLFGTEVHGSTLGIIGMGRIGTEVARRAIGFNMKVIYHNRNKKQIDDEWVTATYVSKDELLRESDFIIIVVPLNDETRDLISFDEFKKMKSSAILVNIARGGVVNTDAITNALQQNQIAAAGLDVTEPEPLPRDHPLLKQSNLVIAPHLGSATHQTRKAMFDLAVSNLLNGMNGKEIVSSVM